MSGEAAACPMEPNASFARGIKFAQDAVQEIREKLVEFEKLHPELPEKACSFLAENLDKSRDGIQALLHLTEVMKCGAAEIPIRAIIGAVSQAGTALSGLQDKAGQFDEKIKPVFGVSALVIPAVEQAYVGLSTVSAYAADHAQKDLTHLKTLSGGLRGEIAAAAKGGPLDKVLKPAPEKAANEAFKITDRVAEVKEVATKLAKELDGKYGPSAVSKGGLAALFSSTAK
eukprot:RCo029491